MNGRNGYAVFFYPQALEALGDGIKPYLQDGPAGAHVRCDEVDTGGAFIELTLHGHDAQGADIALELMVPSAMVRMIVSTQSDGSFGFGPRTPDKPAQPLPVTGPTAPASDAPAQALPTSDSPERPAT